MLAFEGQQRTDPAVFGEQAVQPLRSLERQNRIKAAMRLDEVQRFASESGMQILLSAEQPDALDRPGPASGYVSAGDTEESIHLAFILACRRIDDSSDRVERRQELQVQRSRRCRPGRREKLK